MPADLSAEVIKAELDAPTASCLDFDAEPFAAKSVGLVQHGARRLCLRKQGDVADSFDAFANSSPLLLIPANPEHDRPVRPPVVDRAQRIMRGRDDVDRDD